MTQTITRNILATAFIAILFSILLAMPQPSQAMDLKNDRSQFGERIKAGVASTTASSSRPTLDLSCAQNAVLARETTIIEAWTEFNNTLSGALMERKDALIEAWKITDVKPRAVALKNLWKNWKDASKKAHTTLKADRKAAWNEYKQTMKTECKITKLPREDMELKDASGSVNL